MKIISAEIPVPKEDEVLIKVEYVGICGSDVHGFESGPFIPPKDPNQEIGLVMNAPGRLWLWEAACANLNRDRVNIELAFLAVTVVTVWKANITSARTLILWRHNPTTAAH